MNMVENRILQLNHHPRALSRLYLNSYTNPNPSPRSGSDRTVSYSFKPSSPIRRLSVSFRVKATEVESHQPQWWEKNVPPNMVEIHSTQDFLGALSQAGDRLVVVDFYGTWCGSCRAMFPKLCKIVAEHPEIIFLKVNFDENKSLCKSLNIKVLPYFHLYRGPERLLESFPCTLAKFHKLKDAIATHSKSSASSPVLEKTSDSTSR